MNYNEYRDMVKPVNPKASLYSFVKRLVFYIILALFISMFKDVDVLLFITALGFCDQFIELRIRLHLSDANEQRLRAKIYEED